MLNNYNIYHNDFTTLSKLKEKFLITSLQQNVNALKRSKNVFFFLIQPYNQYKTLSKRFVLPEYATNFATLNSCLFTSFSCIARRVTHPFVERFHYRIVVTFSERE